MNRPPRDPDGEPAPPRAGSAGASTGGPLLLLSAQQREALRRLLEGYRQYAFTQLLPNTARNAGLRQTQALLGQLHALTLSPGGKGWLLLTPEEQRELRRVLTELQEQPGLRARWQPELRLLATVPGLADGWPLQPDGKD